MVRKRDESLLVASQALAVEADDLPLLPTAYISSEETRDPAAEVVKIPAVSADLEITLAAARLPKGSLS